MVSYSGAAAVMFGIGSILSRIIDIPELWEFILGILLVMVPLSFCAVTHLARNKEVWILAVIPVFLFAGFVITELKTDETRKPLYPFCDKNVEVCGTICSVPVQYDENTQFMVEVSQIKSGDRVYDIKDKIKVSTQQPVPSPGESVWLCGKLKLIDFPKNSTSFDSNSYNKRRGVFFSMFAEKAEENTSPPKLSFLNRARLFVNISMDMYIQRFPSKEVPLLKGIILNNKSEIPDEITENMLRTGIYRYIYSPYLHISILVFVLSRIMGNRRSKFFAGICIFLLYLLMNIAVSSAWKICLFFGFSYMMMGLFRIRDIKIPLYLTVLFTGIVSPLTLTEPGFVISVTATVLVRGFSENLNSLLYPVVHNRKLAGFIAIYLIISVGIYPISSFFGFAMTPWSFMAGLVLMPLITMIYVLFYLSFGIYLMVGEVVFLGVPYLIQGVIHISEMASKLPLASVNFGRCSLLFVITFYMLLYCIYRRIKYRRSIFSEILTVLLCIVLSVSTVYGIHDAEVTFLNVGNSDCAIITLPGRKTIMVDGGGSAAYSNYDIGEGEVVPYLKANGINRIDTIILSHYDKDHADGVVTVMKSMPVKEIFAPEYLPNNDYRDIIEKEAELRNIRIYYISGPSEFKLAKNLTCEFLCGGNGDDGNDSSLVARIIYGETSILFTGDISKFVEYRLPDTKADILKVPHHGSKTSSSEDFIKKTSPAFSVISVGEDNPYGHPSKAVVERYEESGTTLLRTDICGDIHFIIGKDRIKKVYGFKEWFIYGGFKKGRIQAADGRAQKTAR